MVKNVSRKQQAKKCDTYYNENTAKYDFSYIHS